MIPISYSSKVSYLFLASPYIHGYCTLHKTANDSNNLRRLFAVWFIGLLYVAL